MTVRYLIGVNKGWAFDVISYIPSRAGTPIRIECPIPFLSAGRFCSPAEVLEDEDLRQLFLQAQAEWFVPLLRRMAAGDDVRLEEIEQAHQAARGTALPRVEDPRELAK